MISCIIPACNEAGQLAKLINQVNEIEKISEILGKIPPPLISASLASIGVTFVGDGERLFKETLDGILES